VRSTNEKRKKSNVHSDNAGGGERGENPEMGPALKGKKRSNIGQRDVNDQKSFQAGGCEVKKETRAGEGEFGPLN